jgi:hypothetical protein
MNIDDRLPSPRNVRKRAVWTLVVIVVGLAVSYFAREMASNARRGTEFEDFVAKLRAAGEPTTPRELYGPEPPDDANSAPAIDAALKSLDETVGRDTTWIVTGPWDSRYSGDAGLWYEKAPPEQIRDLAEFLVRTRPFFGRIASAAEKPRCRFPFTVDGHGMITSDGTSSLQRLSRVLFARAAVDPDPAARVEACRTLCVLARRYEPVESIGHMVRIAMASMALTALRRGVEAGAIDAASARTRLDSLLAPTWLDVHARYFTCELVQQISEFAAILDGRNPPPSGNEIAPSASETFAKWGMIVHDAATWSTQPYAGYVRRARAATATAQTKHEMTLVVLPSVVDGTGRTESRCRLARVALAVAGHRAKHGAFPASLDALKSMFPDGVPLDPYTDAPFVYEKTATGVRIASLGRLGEDKPLDDATLRERCLVWELRR